jgi:hypothetical protein
MIEKENNSTGHYTCLNGETISLIITNCNVAVLDAHNNCAR